jgi:hypothetical protein
MDEPINVPPIPPRTKPPPFFQPTDWQAFGLTALAIFIVYWFSLAPEIGLADSGMYATGAFYPGPTTQPSHPIWTVFGWIFTQLLPFSNVAWRLGVASAFVGALTCGLIALLVSRVGLVYLEGLSALPKLSLRDQRTLRITCGIVAGLGFGFDVSFWPKVAVVDPWPFSVFLFTATLCLLTRWFFRPEQRFSLCLAAGTTAMVLVESEVPLAALLGLVLLFVLGHRPMARDVMFAISLLTQALFAMRHSSPMVASVPYGEEIFFITAILTAITGIVLAVRTRKFLTEWKTLLLCAATFIITLCSNLLLPVFSMTNPPMNSGYQRTIEGFFHPLSRGEYGSGIGDINFNCLGILNESCMYLKLTAENWGVFYLLVAAVPLLVLWKLPAKLRWWIIGLFGSWLFTLLIMLGVLPTRYYDDDYFSKSAPYFAITHLPLALLSGVGLALITACVACYSVSKPKPLPTA